ncbi:hypothetical protein [Hymenobacter sediminicola]|uniref:Uncharacterized protein n=1 Tax=Hymenobacter sediminicola TaxID=2761579 RepID=A0A7G7W7Y9_9BACT|nr:hypothetical protein [Hymenobacter sediminicola]QNH62482.1 hypothetical protein H4317_01250 [Hymenobacter sediminicola]
MDSIPNASPPVMAWIVALLLSVGLNVYLLVAPAAPRQSVSVGTTRMVSTSAPDDNDDDDDSNEEDDASWVALSEELRQTRRQLAECQGRAVAPVLHQVVSQ